MTLHLIFDKFGIIDEYIKFINKHFDKKEHQFLSMLVDNGSKPKRVNAFTANINNICNVLSLLKQMHKHQKIIFHGITGLKIYCMLLLAPWLLNKCYWVIWGADLYGDILGNKTIKYWLYFQTKKILLSRIAGYVTYLEGDYELARKVYRSKTKYFECIMYPSNIFKDMARNTAKNDNNINILVGHSAAAENNHLEIFKKLKGLDLSNCKIYCPLNYGNNINKDLIIKTGKELFGERFIVLQDLMKAKDYYAFLSTIDVAIFNNERQAAMGNIISLLGMGKIVFIRDDITPWRLFESLGIKIFKSNGTIDLSMIKLFSGEKNIEIIKNYFSEQKLIDQLTRLFDA